MTSDRPGARRPDRRDPHSLADHLYGALEPHEHGPDADHDHDDFGPAGAIEDNPIWLQDNVTLTSVGIDIGSAGTQIVFSRLLLRRLGEDLTSRYFVVSRETLFQSPVTLTPYRDEESIDAAALGAVIDEAYAAAGLHPDDIDAGVVILTGEALRRDNAQSIAQILAERGGEFVCATAGHHMEAMLAGYGSGAALASHEAAAAGGRRILNVDIGGGTTKLALAEAGRIVATAALHVGGRLEVVDETGRIMRLDPAGRHHAARAGFDRRLGDTVSDGEMDAIAERMADLLVAALTVRPLPTEVDDLYLTDPIAAFGAVDGIMFSGGVAEYVYGREERDFGDMGRRLGRALRRRLDDGRLPWPLLPAGECIRATALGASEYSVQLSGNTSYISNPRQLLPRRNLQVLQPPCEFADVVDPDSVARAIRAHATAFDVDLATADFALALQWRGVPAYQRIRDLAQGIVDALAERIAARRPLYIMFDGDVAQTLGAMLREELGVESEILAIDGVALWDFDYIDLGRIRLPSFTVPVTIKSLVFSEDPRGPRPRQRLHHHPHHDHHPHHHSHDHHHGHDHEAPGPQAGQKPAG